MSIDSMPEPPWWQPALNAVDGRLSPPLSALLRSSVLADAMSFATRLEVRARRRFERQSNWWLHQYNLPSAGDVRHMRAQLAAVDARLRDISERLEAQERAAAAEAGGQRSG